MSLTDVCTMHPGQDVENSILPECSPPSGPSSPPTSPFSRPWPSWFPCSLFSSRHARTWVPIEAVLPSAVIPLGWFTLMWMVRLRVFRIALRILAFELLPGPRERKPWGFIVTSSLATSHEGVTGTKREPVPTIGMFCVHNLPHECQAPRSREVSAVATQRCPKKKRSWSPGYKSLHGSGLISFKKNP